MTAPSASAISDFLREVRESGDFERFLEAIPYLQMLGVSVKVQGEDLLVGMEGRESLIGNPVLPALHGGTVGALMESAAILRLLREPDCQGVPKTITLTVDYLRSPRVKQTWARATITRFGRRVANVQVQAWQDEQDRPIAVAHAHFLLKSQ
ncbi:MAG: PaaI family thioesterase [Myxococcales bacterium]